MTPTTSAIVWCVLQVTIFSLAAGVLYLVARRVAAGAGPGVLGGSLALVLAITALAASPWPRWQWTPAAPQPAPATPVVAELGPIEAEAPEAEAPAAEPSPFLAAWETFAQALTTPVEAPQENTSTAFSAITWFRWLLLACLVVSAARWTWGVWQVNRLVSRSRPLDDERLVALRDGLQASLGLEGEIRLWESSEIATPATLGWRRQHVLLPESWRDWGEGELRAALAHELSHVAARDYRTWVVARLAVAVHFYHPVVRWLASRLQLEQELAADAAAAELVGDRTEYLRRLASLALATPAHRLAGPARTLIPSRSLLMRRVEMLRNSSSDQQSRRKRNPMNRVTLALLAVLAVAIAGVRRPAVQAEEPAEVLSFVLNPAADRLLLDLVPIDTVYVISARPAELLAAEAYEPIVSEFSKLPPLSDAGVSARDVAEVMLIVRGQGNSRPRIALRFHSPEVCPKVVRSLFELPEDAPMDASTQEWVKPSMRVTRLDETTLVIDQYRGDVDALPSVRAEVSHDWSAEYRSRSKDHLVAAISVPALRAAMSPNDRKRLLGGFPLQGLAPALEHTEWVVAGAGLGESLTVDAVAQCDTPEHAEQVRDIVNAVLTLAVGVVDQQKSATLGRFDQLPAEVQQEMAPMRPMAEKMFGLAAEFVSARSRAEGGRVSLAHATDSLSINDAAFTSQMLLPPVKAATAAFRRTRNGNNLRAIALGLLNYESANGHFPPAVLYKEGSPHPYSWRVAILPYIDQFALYQQYRFDEPWDSEANRKIAQVIVPAYRSSMDKVASTNTSFFALTGPGTVFDGDDGMQLRNITDGMSRTILVVEAKHEVPWTKPEDLPYSPDEPLPKLGGWQEGYFSCVLCDGSVRQFELTTDEATLRGMITRNGEE